MTKVPKRPVSYPRIDGTKFDAKRIRDFDSWRKDLLWLLKEELPIKDYDIDDETYERLAWNIAFIIVTN